MYGRGMSSVGPSVVGVATTDGWRSWAGPGGRQLMARRETVQEPPLPVRPWPAYTNAYEPPHLLSGSLSGHPSIGISRTATSRSFHWMILASLLMASSLHERRAASAAHPYRESCSTRRRRYHAAMRLLILLLASACTTAPAYHTLPERASLGLPYSD